METIDYYGDNPGNCPACSQPLARFGKNLIHATDLFTETSGPPRSRTECPAEAPGPCPACGSTRVRLGTMVVHEGTNPRRILYGCPGDRPAPQEGALIASGGWSQSASQAVDFGIPVDGTGVTDCPTCHQRRIMVSGYVLHAADANRPGHPSQYRWAASPCNRGTQGTFPRSPFARQLLNDLRMKTARIDAAATEQTGPSMESARKHAEPARYTPGSNPAPNLREIVENAAPPVRSDRAQEPTLADRLGPADELGIRIGGRQGGKRVRVLREEPGTASIAMVLPADETDVVTLMNMARQMAGDAKLTVTAIEDDHLRVSWPAKTDTSKDRK